VERPVGKTLHIAGIVLALFVATYVFPRHPLAAVALVVVALVLMIRFHGAARGSPAAAGVLFLGQVAVFCWLV
jgi:hypothetical protein